MRKGKKLKNLSEGGNDEEIFNWFIDFIFFSLL